MSRIATKRERYNQRMLSLRVSEDDPDGRVAGAESVLRAGNGFLPRRVLSAMKARILPLAPGKDPGLRWRSGPGVGGAQGVGHDVGVAGAAPLDFFGDAHFERLEEDRQEHRPAEGEQQGKAPAVAAPAVHGAQEKRKQGQVKQGRGEPRPSGVAPERA